MEHLYHSTDENVGLSLATRLLIHYTGDVHQPLHAAARVNDEFPKGDRGGNDLTIKPKDGTANLHAVWDSIMYS